MWIVFSVAARSVWTGENHDIPRCAASMTCERGSIIPSQLNHGICRFLAELKCTFENVFWKYRKFQDALLPWLVNEAVSLPFSLILKVFIRIKMYLWKRFWKYLRFYKLGWEPRVSTLMHSKKSTTYQRCAASMNEALNIGSELAF